MHLIFSSFSQFLGSKVLFEKLEQEAAARAALSCNSGCGS
jgi:hypothetical protein